MTQQPVPSRSKIIAAYAAVYIIWGSTYLGILYAIQTIPPFLMMGSRFLMAGLLLLGWCLLKGERLPDKSSLLKLALSGFLMLAIGNGAVTWVEQHLPTGLAAIIVATVPLWFVLLDKAQWRFYFSNKGIIAGLLTGFAGVLLLFSGKGSMAITGSAIKLISFFVLLGGTIAWAVGSLLSKYQTIEGSTAMKVAVQMLTAGMVAYITAFATGEHQGFALSQVSLSSVLALGYLVLAGSLVGYLAYIWLLGVEPPSRVGTYAYVNPVVAVFLGWLLVDETLSLQQGIALCVTLAGVVLVNLSKEQKPGASKAAPDLTPAKTIPARANSGV